MILRYDDDDDRPPPPLPAVEDTSHLVTKSDDVCDVIWCDSSR